jgi:hypothetical protein
MTSILSETKIKLRYVGCKTARDNLRAASNTWLYDGEIKDAKNYADSEATEEQCLRYLTDLEESVSRRASFAIKMF